MTDRFNPPTPEAASLAYNKEATRLGKAPNTLEHVSDEVMKAAKAAKAAEVGLGAYRGVYRTAAGTFRAGIKVNSKSRKLGTFTLADAAALAYNRQAALRGREPNSLKHLSDEEREAGGGGCGAGGGKGEGGARLPGGWRWRRWRQGQRQGRWRHGWQRQRRWRTRL